MVDHYSDYIELDSLSGNTSANSVMKRQFARHGISDELITDNGPQFESHEYSRFAEEYGFTILQPEKWESRVSS